MTNSSSPHERSEIARREEFLENRKAAGQMIDVETRHAVSYRSLLARSVTRHMDVTASDLSLVPHAPYQMVDRVQPVQLLAEDK